MKCEECRKKLAQGEGHYTFLGFNFCKSCWSSKRQDWQKKEFKKMSTEEEGPPKEGSNGSFS